MIQLKEYSEREISIFEGIIVLLSQGRQLHELKVADIADAAGIGKSTVYEYFTSKEDIIKEAVRYHVYREFNALTDFISSQDSFTGIIDKAMDYIVDMLETRFSSLLMMVFNLDQSELKGLCCKDNDMLTVIQSGINEQLKRILQVGKDEKLIDHDVTADDCRMVLNGMMSAFTNEVRHYQMKSTLSHNEKLKDYTGDLPVQSCGYADWLTELKNRTLRIILKALQ